MARIPIFNIFHIIAFTYQVTVFNVSYVYENYVTIMAFSHRILYAASLHKVSNCVFRSKNMTAVADLGDLIAGYGHALVA